MNGEPGVKLGMETRYMIDIRLRMQIYVMDLVSTEF